VFNNCSSALGGAIYLNNPENVMITNSSFYNNKAYNDSSLDSSGYGGALYYTCPTSSGC
jgi:hypothetical protein